MTERLSPSDWPVRLDTPTEDRGGAVWVAADESGWTGGALLEQRVMTHATVRIDDHLAGSVLEELRASTGLRQSREVKFWQFSRDKPLAALADLLRPGGELHGRATILVADKTYVAVSGIVDLLLGEHTPHEHLARTLVTDGARVLGPLWEPLVAGLAGFSRGTRRRETTVDLPSFFGLLQAAHRRSRGHPTEEVLALLLRSRHQAEDLLSAERPALDPFPHMLATHIEHRHAELTELRLLHDQHKMLTPELVLRCTRGKSVRTFAVGTSSEHPSIQLADLISGAGRVVFDAHQGRPGKQASVLHDVVRPLITWAMQADDTF
ncbi:hypothetical protein [Allokutzneria oryzae]|uniref:DUF3800 domain-containing protein n=1 Tax=Allokutzneria oryzae TaxID=1378989 RepID=A0ABV6A682_9PSEU